MNAPSDPVLEPPVTPADSPGNPPVASPTISRSYHCGNCDKPIFLRNSLCLNGGTVAGYEPERRTMVSLLPTETEAVWEIVGEPGARAMRCANLDTAAACNWLIDANPDGSFDKPNQYPGFCLACSLNRMVPDQSIDRNQELWRRIEIAKRRLVSQLLALALPVETRLERPNGLAFDMIENDAVTPRVMTGHNEGLITLNIEEADDAVREQLRAQMREPYRTLLGHFRHEIGHYYWDRMVRDSGWLEPFRALFGDEREDYAGALQRHYQVGPPAEWAQRYVTSYATAHPWEDWAETWAHYLHMSDTVDTALSFGINTDSVDLQAVPFELPDLWQPEHPNAAGFLLFLNTWVRLTNVFNELSRAMGQNDYYPFILPRATVAKLQFIHEVIRSASVGDAAQVAPPAQTDAQEKMQTQGQGQTQQGPDQTQVQWQGQAPTQDGAATPDQSSPAAQPLEALNQVY